MQDMSESERGISCREDGCSIVGGGCSGFILGSIGGAFSSIFFLPISEVSFFQNVITGTALGTTAGLSIAAILVIYQRCGASNRAVDIESPQPQEDTQLLPAQDDEAEKVDTCLGQFGRCWTGLFAKKPEFESVNDLPDTHPVHQI